jgi:molybdenum cofactor guanylyltransferase
LGTVQAVEIEGILLTGGASRRMGHDKAALLIEGVPLAERIASELAKRAAPVTVLGRESIAGFGFLADSGEYQGPLVALSRFVATKPFVFVAACDLPAFDAGVVDVLGERIGEYDAAIPEVEGRLQPLCALYRAEALRAIPELVAAGERRIMRWMDGLRIVSVPAQELPSLLAATSVNTPDELRAIVDGPDAT